MHYYYYYYYYIAKFKYICQFTHHCVDINYF